MVVLVIERNCDVTKDNTGGDMGKPNIVLTLTWLLSLEGHREQSMVTAVLTDVKLIHLILSRLIFTFVYLGSVNQT